eukprot:CAMPEP_0113945216 /NCGR_PEP_ID=MMETSP1339-20121228/41440_1 /TAXON_ID=94617 /ORGANISM="Fibrocapsa japonica" /LENGTH=143 /DNA_ID=CAMNT_0000950675 /DNA_START=8 /DNA_END=436 /DNA_ORIENTATION=+ /assembly_acc=CAM_ASM_000762
MKTINGVIPLMDIGLGHLKRIKKSTEGSLQVIITTPERFDGIDADTKKALDSFQLPYSLFEVPKYPPRSKAEYEWSQTVWPTVFHSGLSEEVLRKSLALSPEEREAMSRGMQLAISDFEEQGGELKGLGASCCSGIGAVIMDP